MTAVQLIEQADCTFELIIINPLQSFVRGIAYQADSAGHLLNVRTAKMSAYPDQPDHFLRYAMQQDVCRHIAADIVAQSFLPRAFYGDYLQQIWQNAVTLANQKNILIRQINAKVTQLLTDDIAIRLTLDNGTTLDSHYAVLATGNQPPGIGILNELEDATIVCRSHYYIDDPWLSDVTLNKGDKAVLILGNGLTMVDTVMALRQQGNKQPILSLSRNGYNMLAHPLQDVQYSDIGAELLGAGSLQQQVKIVIKHIRLLTQQGLSAEPVIDAIRPYTQQLWRQLSVKEKRFFMKKIRHLWGVARHRLPADIYQKLQQMRFDGQLQLYAGKLLTAEEVDGGIKIQFYDKKTQKIKTAVVSAIINCTGPETDISKLKGHFLRQAEAEGIVVQDALRLGIKADVTCFRVYNRQGRLHKNLFTLGPLLKGELWESTAVKELRLQAEQLAASLLQQISFNN